MFFIHSSFLVQVFKHPQKDMGESLLNEIIFHTKNIVAQKIKEADVKCQKNELGKEVSNFHCVLSMMPIFYSSPQKK